TYPWHVNLVAPDNYFGNIADGDISEGGSEDFYATYAVGKNKPFCLSEGAGTLHLNYSMTGDNGTFVPAEGTATRTDIQMSYWNTFLFNSTFRSTHPHFKMAFMFEFEKLEHDADASIYRDFRTTRDPDTLAAFKAQLADFDASFKWANALAPTTTTTTTTQGPTQGATAGPKGGMTTAGVVATTTDAAGKSGARAARASIEIAAAVGVLGMLLMLFA
ncbi:hypothetical protein HK101_003354, partial [Irineochytrium annulatum]